MSKPQPTSIPTYPDSIGRRLTFAGSAVTALTGELLREHDLSPLQWVALAALWRQDGMTVTVLADYMRASVSATSRLLGRMETRGLIERRTVKSNRRILEVWLTAAGKKLRHLDDLYVNVNELVLADLSPAERATFIETLERISDAATVEAERRKPQKRAKSPRRNQGGKR